MTAYFKFLLFKPLILATMLSFLNVSVGYSVEPKKHLYIMGGGGEPEGEKTIFDYSLEKLATFSNSPGWDTKVSFNGGHATTEKIIKDKMKKAKNVGPFVRKNYNDLIEDMITKINNGTLTKNDQLMLTINTHGSPAASGESVHKIALAYGESVSARELNEKNSVNMDRLQTLINLAEAKNVKLAILDMSCFSGNLQKLKGPKACLISSTGPDNYGYEGVDTFTTALYEKMKPGKNLEEIFLEARKVGPYADFPMISTPAGRAVNEVFYSKVSPFFTYNDSTTNDFSYLYDVTKIDEFKAAVCSVNNVQQDMQAFIKKIKDMELAASHILEKDLKAAVDNYYKFQKQYEIAIAGLYEANEEVKKILERDFPNKKELWKDFSGMDMVTYDFEAQAEEVKQNLGSESMKTLLAKTLEQVKISKQLNSKIPSTIKDKFRKYKSAVANVEKTKLLAVKVSIEAKKLYENLYKSKMSEKSNPCKDFVL